MKYNFYLIFTFVLIACSDEIDSSLENSERLKQECLDHSFERDTLLFTSAILTKEEFKYSVSNATMALGFIAFNGSAINMRVRVGFEHLGEELLFDDIIKGTYSYELDSIFETTIEDIFIRRGSMIMINEGETAEPLLESTHDFYCISSRQRLTFELHGWEYKVIFDK